MNDRCFFHERLQRAIEPTCRGVVGVVDDLLALCREQGLHLDWQANQIRVQSLAGEPQESTELPLQKSVFRAMLARIAALCNERHPNSVSPFGGEGEVFLGAIPQTLLRVAFTNTPSELRLEIGPSADLKNGTNEKESLGAKSLS